MHLRSLRLDDALVIRTRNAGQRRSLSPCLGLRRDLGFARLLALRALFIDRIDTATDQLACVVCRIARVAQRLPSGSRARLIRSTQS